MERGLKAAALFALIVVASADRALLAGKTSGGGLHAVAIPAIQGGNLPAGTGPNYFITNGNGTWTYSYYSNNGNVNGNNAGQGAATYPPVNQAFQAASLNTATNTLWSSTARVQTGTAGTSVFAAAVTVPALAVANAGSPVITGFTGINAVTFPSRNLGVAVGGLTAANTPNIIITVDGGQTWLLPTGLPTVTPATGLNAAANAYPAVSAGDLTAVYFASKTTGWAVGGNAIFTVGAAIGNDALPAGVLYATTNGGTVWKNVPLFYTKEQLQTAALSGSTTALAALYNQFVPGFLFSIGADAAGKNLYAVGSPGMTATVNGLVPTYAQQRVPTIIYSGNAGASWVSQVAPATNGFAYGLYAIAVQKGTTAWAVGGDMTNSVIGGQGNPSVNPNAPPAFLFDGNTNGQIIYTTNGGFSWAQAVFPKNNNAKAPVFTTVALNGPTAWVGGFTKLTEYYPVPQVQGSAGLTAVSGEAYSVLISTDGKKFVGATAYATFPAGFVQNSGLLTTAGTITQKDVFGIVWDNSLRGFIHGLNFIMGTSDGGKTWVFESPADLVSTTGQAIKSLATVPTSY